MLKIVNDKLYIYWDHCKDACKTFCDKIKQQNIKIDNIVAITRGGLIPATIISHILGIRDIQYITMQTYSNEGIKFDTPKLKEEDKQKLKDLKNVLIVDDIADSGETMLTLSNELPEAILFALIVKPKAKELLNNKIECEYPYDIKQGDWIVFPWEPQEDINECWNYHGETELKLTIFPPDTKNWV